MKEYTRINAHGHLLPNPDWIPRFMKEKEIFWISSDRKFMYQKNWERPIIGTGYFIDDKLLWMDKFSIDHEVILNLSQLYCNGMERSLASDVIRFQNDFNAEMQSNHADKITAGFVVQPAYINDALREIERCVNELNLKVLCLPTHFLSLDGLWTSVADPIVEPIFNLADRLSLAVEIHPYDAQKIINLKNQNWRFHVVWMCAQTADTYHMFTLLNYYNKYPNMRTCFAHGNQFGQINVGRRSQGFEGRPDLFDNMAHPREAIGADNIFFDTLVHDVLSLELLIKRQGVSQVVLGLDNPYPLGEIDGVGDGYPGKLLDDAVEMNIITENDRKEIWHNNVLRWIYNDN